MEDVLAVLFFLLILAGSAFEAYWKSKKKKEAEAALPRTPKERRPPPRPARAQAAERAHAAERARAAAGARAAGTAASAPPVGEHGVEVPEEILEWLRRGRAPIPAEPAGPSSWERGKVAEAEASEEAAVVSLESVRPRPERAPARPRIEEAGVPIGAALDAPPTVVRRRVRPLPTFAELSTVQRAFVWAEILGRPVGDRGTGATTPPGLLD